MYQIRLDQEIWPEIENALDQSKKIEKEYIIKNTNRAVGTRISIIFIKNMVMKN